LDQILQQVFLISITTTVAETFVSQHDISDGKYNESKNIDSLRISSSFRAGKKKFVDRAYVPDKGVEVIMKSQANDLDIKVKCLQSVYDNDKCSKMDFQSPDHLILH
jgi:hypothetical protein